jgi:hypothetical protein
VLEVALLIQITEKAEPDEGNGKVPTKYLGRPDSHHRIRDELRYGTNSHQPHITMVCGWILSGKF